LTLLETTLASALGILWEGGERERYQERETLIERLGLVPSHACLYQVLHTLGETRERDRRARGRERGRGRHQRATKAERRPTKETPRERPPRERPHQRRDHTKGEERGRERETFRSLRMTVSPLAKPSLSLPSTPHPWRESRDRPREREREARHMERRVSLSLSFYLPFSSHDCQSIPVSTKYSTPLERIWSRHRPRERERERRDIGRGVSLSLSLSLPLPSVLFARL